MLTRLAEQACLLVSRCQAKMKRPLTPEDFTAKHKYSFDMWVLPVTSRRRLFEANLRLLV
jgi:hypothetical protein